MNAAQTKLLATIGMWVFCILVIPFVIIGFIGTFFIAGLWTGGMIFIGATQKVIDLADW